MDNGAKITQSLEIIQLIYFKGCPNVDNLRSILEKLKLTFKEVIQDEIPLENDLRKYSSPSLIINNKLIVGGRLNDGCQSCTFLEQSSIELLIKRECKLT